jgi:hypothetical protein
MGLQEDDLGHLERKLMDLGLQSGAGQTQLLSSAPKLVEPMIFVWKCYIYIIYIYIIYIYYIYGGPPQMFKYMVGKIY